jgi:hypothetical protein
MTSVITCGCTAVVGRSRKLEGDSKQTMTEAELHALLDVHDALVKSCVDSTLPIEHFLALYNDFPNMYVLDRNAATADERSVLQRSQRRIAFHFRVAGALSGLFLGTDAEKRLLEEVARFAPEVGLMRLRALVMQYPEFKAEPETRN